MKQEEVQDLPTLDESYELTADQISAFQDKGHIRLKGVANTSEIAAYRPHIANTVRDLHTASVPLEERDTYGKAFIQIGNLWEENEACKSFAMARRFAKIAAELMGVDGVRMYHDQALFKEAGGGFTPWHQDQIYWPLDTMNTVTMWMPLVDVPEEVGSMTFASGTHHSGYISKLVISDESHKTLKQYIEGKGIETVTYGALNAGDATFHTGWTLHSAPGNPTDLMREVMTIIYVADQTRVLEPDSNARRNDLQRWLPGLKPGDLINTHLNPLLYSKHGEQTEQTKQTEHAEHGGA